MSVKGMRLEGEPTGQLTIRAGEDVEVYDIHEEPHSLPCNPKRQEICKQHLQEKSADLIQSFLLEGMVFSDKSGENIVRYQIACKGLTRALERCRLTLTQYDSKGKKLSQGRVK